MAGNQDEMVDDQDQTTSNGDQATDNGDQMTKELTEPVETKKEMTQAAAV